MKKPIRPYSVLIKALHLFLFINLGFAWINPPVSSFSLINRVLPGFERFPVILSLVTLPDGTVSVQRSVIRNLDILFSAHEISGSPKPADEYRVVLFGESPTWGTGLSPQQTLAGFINQADLKTCTGQKIRVYNLAVPGYSATKDLLTMERSLDFDPDMFIWSFTLETFDPSYQNKRLVGDNPGDYQNLLQKYDLITSIQKMEDNPKPGFMENTLWDQRQNLSMQLQIQGYSLKSIIYGTDDIRSSIWIDGDLIIKPPGTGNRYNGLLNNGNLFKFERLIPFDTLRVAHEIAGDRPLLMVNEPIFIISGAMSDIRYNSLYPRWAMDQFREFMAAQVSANHWIFADDWDLLSQNEFLDNVIHRNATGNLHLAVTLFPLMQEYSCQQN